MLGNLVAAVAQPVALAASLYGGVNAAIDEVAIAKTQEPAAAEARVGTIDSRQSLDLICAAFAGALSGMPSAGVAACHAATQPAAVDRHPESAATL